MDNVDIVVNANQWTNFVLPLCEVEVCIPIIRII